MTGVDTYPHQLAGEEAGAPQNPSPLEIAAARAELASRPPVAMAGELLTANPWRKAGAIDQLFFEANAANPRRDKTSDGTIGNASHAENWTSSDHNPFVIVAGIGVVRAGDLDVDGLDMALAMERMRLGALAGRLPQFLEGGYGIYNGRITAPDFSGWRIYNGANKHVLHGHFSVSRVAWRFDNRSPMGLFLPPAQPKEDDMALTPIQAQQLANAEMLARTACDQLGVHVNLAPGPDYGKRTYGWPQLANRDGRPGATVVDGLARLQDLVEQLVAAQDAGTAET